MLIRALSCYIVLSRINTRRTLLPSSQASPMIHKLNRVCSPFNFFFNLPGESSLSLTSMIPVVAESLNVWFILIHSPRNIRKRRWFLKEVLGIYEAMNKKSTLDLKSFEIQWYDAYIDFTLIDVIFKIWWNFMNLINDKIVLI